MTTPPTPEQVKARIATIYDQTATTYDMLRFVRRIAERLLERAELQPGERVLDVATGTGHVALAGAQAVGTAGRVVGIDLSEEMLEQARQKADAAGMTNVEFRQGDAERLEFPDASFDVVLCASAIFFFPDQPAASREWLRVLRPGGRVLFTSFGEGGWELLSRLPLSHLQKYGAAVGTGPSGEASRADPRHCVALLDAAGFVETATTTEQLGYYFTSIDEYWEEVNQSNTGIRIRQLAPDAKVAFRRDLLAEVTERATEAGLWRDTPTNFAFGRRP